MSTKRVDLKKILADTELRRKLMVSTIQATQAREGIQTTVAQANRAYYVVTEGEKTSFFDLDKFKPGKAQDDLRHEMFVRTLRNGPNQVRFDIARRDFSAIDGAPLNYRGIGSVAHIFRESPALEPNWGIAAQGLATADDPRFVRCRWEVTRDAIGEGRVWAPFAKGGEFSRFYADIHLVVLWRDHGEEIRRFEGAYIRNEHSYFKAGLTWPLRTQRGFNLRVMPSGCVFGHKGPAVFPKKESDSFYLLGVANSTPAEYLLRGLMSFGSWEVGVIKRLPVPTPSPEQRGQIARLAQSIFEAKKKWDRGNETSAAFVSPWLLDPESHNSASIAAALDRLAELELEEDNRIREHYRDLNDHAYAVYGIPASTRSEIEEDLGERPPEVIWPQMEGKDTGQKRLEHVWRLLSYAVKLVVEADQDGLVPLLPVAGEAPLLDRVHAELAKLFPTRDVNGVEVEIVNELKRKAKGYDRASSIREWLEDLYFAYHASLYRNRPIFWHISSKQGKGPAAFSALVHYHRFDKDRMAKLRGVYLRDALTTFRREAALAGQQGRTDDRLDWQAKVEEAEELDRRLQKVQEGFHQGGEDYRILTPWKPETARPKGWDPDINDGVKVNIEPLQRASILRISEVV
ncbi:MAG: hypothetical protein ACK5TN_05545 [Acidobacteriota bacterium]